MAALIASVGSCGPSVVRVEGLLAQSLRSLELWNLSKGYVVFRVAFGEAPAVVTPALPPGGEFNANVEQLFGALCAESIRIEIFAYQRADPQRSPLEDETLENEPYASTQVVLLRNRHFGCQADTEVISLIDTIFCHVVAVEPESRRIAYQAGSAGSMFELIAQVDSDRGLPDPPTPVAGEQFALVGRVIDREGRGVAGATVELVDYDIELSADQDGRFEFDRPSGNYGLRVRVEGYQVSPSSVRAVHRSPQSGPVIFVATRK